MSKERLKDFEFEINGALSSYISAEDSKRIKRINQWEEQLIFGDKEQTELIKRISFVQNLIEDWDVEEILRLLYIEKDRNENELEMLDEEIWKLENRIEWLNYELDDVENNLENINTLIEDLEE